MCVVLITYMLMFSCLMLEKIQWNQMFMPLAFYCGKWWLTKYHTKIYQIHKSWRESLQTRCCVHVMWLEYQCHILYSVLKFLLPAMKLWKWLFKDAGTVNPTLVLYTFHNYCNGGCKNICFVRTRFINWLPCKTKKTIYTMNISSYYIMLETWSLEG